MATNRRTLRERRSQVASRLLGRRAQRVLLVCGALAVSIEGVLMAVIPPATSYETSIITAYPLEFWVCFGVALASTIAVFLGSAITASRYWRHGLALLTCVYGLFFALPIARGYKLYDRGTSDALVHLGSVKTVLATGELPDGLFYPLEHLIVSTLVMVGVPPEATRSLFPFAFTMVFVCSGGLLARQLIDRPRALALGLCAATPLIYTEFQITDHPAMFSFLLFPLVLMLLDRHRWTASGRFVALFVMLAFAIIFFHPVTTLFLIALVASTVVFDFLYDRVHEGTIRRLRPGLALIIVPAAFRWYIGFGRTQQAIQRVATASGETPAARQATEIGAVALTTEQLATRFVQLYGAVFIYLVIAGLFCLFVLPRVLRRRDTYVESYTAYQFTVGFGIAGAFLLAYLIAFSPIRVSRYMIFAAVLAVAVVLHRCLAGSGYTRQVLPLLVGCAIVLAAILGAFTAYDPNKHMTRAEYQGTEFMLGYHDDDLAIRSFGLSDKMTRYVLGDDHREFQVEPFNQSSAEHTIAPRLGYGANDTAARSFGRSYLVTQAYDREYYTATYFTESQQQALFVYNESDVARLSRDPTVDKIYENGGFEGWYVSERSGN